MGTVVGMAEFLKKVAKLRSNKQKVEALKYNDSLPLRIILQGAFDPKVKWLLPEEDPPYKPTDLVDQEHVLLKNAEKLRYFVEGFYDLPQGKREMMFIDLLERVAPEDAELLLAIKNKKLPWDTIKADIVKEALPGLF